MARHERKATNTTSQAMRAQTIGTHVSRESMRARDAGVSFSNQRAADRATRGEITHVVPSTRTGETAHDFGRRTRALDYAAAERRRLNRRRAALAAVVVLVALALVGGVAWFAYNSSVDAQMRLDDNNTALALTAPASDDAPCWVLLAGEFHDPAQPYSGPDLLELVHMDPQTGHVVLLNVPSNVRVVLSDDVTHYLREAQTVGSDAALIGQVEQLAGVRVAHFAKINQSGFVQLVDALGGVEVELPEEVDDPRAGWRTLPAGPVQLDGQLALQVVRSHNYAQPDVVQPGVQNAVLAALMQKLQAAGGLGALSTIDAITRDFQTDLTFAQMSTMLAPFAAGAQLEMLRCPGSLVESDGVERFVVRADELAALVATIEGGEMPQPQDPASGAYDPATVTVDVRNGTSIPGAAGLTAQALAAAGYQVGEPSNTESAVYTETLVIYQTDDLEPTAQAVARTMGCGRVADASLYYNFDDDILVVIGADWIAPSTG